MSKKESSTFCIMPFIHLSAKTSGALRLCCEAANSDIEPRSVLGDRAGLMKEVWRGDFYSDTRNKMLNSKKVSSCSICYKKEERGVRSRRQEYNEAWEEKLGSEIFEQIRTGRVLDRPLYLDLRQGSICNLKCRMCNSMTSTSFAKEWAELQSNSAELSPEHFPEEQDHLRYSKKMKPWYDSDAFWDELLLLAPTLKKLYLTGGEPLLIKNNLKLLKTLLEAGNNSPEIVINTNLTVISEEFLQCFSQFPHGNLSLSLDGVGAINDYIRYPSRWSELEENFHKVTQYKINVDMTYTLQAYNFFGLIDFLKWVNEKAMDAINYIDWNILDRPTYLAIDVLPLKERELYLDQLEHYIAATENQKNQNIYNKLRDKFPLLKKEYNPKEGASFLRYTRMLDQKRNQDLGTQIPALNFLGHLKEI